MIQISPSILSGDMAFLGRSAREVEEAGADMLHVDVMDGCFVPNMTIGPGVVAALHEATSLPLDVHLMIERPERYVEAYAQAGASIITVHVEATTHLHRTIQQIRSAGVKAGVTLNPATSISTLEEILPHVDMVLVMSVNPGFSGQKFIRESVDKIARLRRMMEERHAVRPIEVDGGINADIAREVVRAGASILVSGSWLFRHPKGLKVGVEELRRAAETAHAEWV